MEDPNIKKKKKVRISRKIEFDKDISVKYENGFLSIKGKNGESGKKLLSKNIKIKIENNKIFLEAKKTTKREKKVIASFEAHIKNLIHGISTGFKYTLKICSGHFPMSVSTNNNEFIIKNFLGEKIPRKLIIKEGADVKVEGDQIIVESNNKELVGQVSADIENLTKRPGYDGRIFQDGCYITSKGKRDA